MKNFTEKDLGTLLSMIKGGNDNCPYLHTWSNTGALYRGCLELEKRGLVKRKLEEGLYHICWVADNKTLNLT